MSFRQLTCQAIVILLVAIASLIAAPREEVDVKPPATQPAAAPVPQIKASVLYMEGYPRWEYRYLVAELSRQKDVKLSVLLFSADAETAQAGNKPIKAVPDDEKQFAEYDVIVMGDVESRRFTDRQLLLMADFVKRGGGFIMIAGQRWSPAKYKDTPLEEVLPVKLIDMKQAAAPADKDGFRPAITAAGVASPAFRFLEDAQENEKLLKEELQPLFWYCRGIGAKAETTVLAEHPADRGADNAGRAPLLVAGKFGEGRTMFSAVDDTWRWRYHGSSAFATYWLQQVQAVAPAAKRD